MAGKVYIEVMRHAFATRVLLLLLAGLAVAWPIGAGAQSFMADYVIRPTYQADGQFNGAGLSLAAGENWFAQVAVGRSLQSVHSLTGVNSTEALRIGGGYRWSDGQSLSMHVTGGKGPERLGLSVSYDWPRYFVQLSYDAGLKPVPQDRVRFSAGMRF